ncbi:alpha/beta fold hydrolase [Leptolyngbya sp. FACHB-17]|uniref:alpha/beta fold hydrolase n=1 Tax=unclassified Leptolyngbya TaxID=2650499 RepID=UPI00168104F8|nr:alpha/beta hydrolase [Leptolyngbya sp. FACHB-17]
MASTILTRNHVTIHGQGDQPMLFAHGFGCDQNMWRFVTPDLENAHKLVLFDYVGSGKSDLNAYNIERYSNLNGYVEDVLEICEALNLTDVIFVGHSVSSIIGILASIQAPQYFSRLILVCPSPCYINDLPDYLGGFDRSDIEGLLDLMEKNYIGWANFLAPMIMQNKERPELINELETSFCSTDPVIAHRFAEVTFFSDNRRDLLKVSIPSLILQCSEDAIAPIEVGQYVHRYLHRSELRIMQATGHCPHMSHPQESLDLIKDYLATTYVI